MKTKIKIDLRKVVIAVSAISALITGSIFLLMYSSSKAEIAEPDLKASVSNSIVITPDNMCSYGELMFAYIGKNNYIYNIDDETVPLIEQPASQLLYSSDDTVIYVSPTETNAMHYGRESVIQELQIGEHENNLYTIAAVSINPCWSSNDEVVYFVNDDEPSHLYSFEPLTSSTELAAEFEENIVGLRISSDGLLVTIESGAEMLYVPLSKTLTETYYDCQGSRVLVCEQYDLILTPSGELYYRWIGSNEAVKLADNVAVAESYQDNLIFFIQNTPEGKGLYAYYISEEVTEKLVEVPENVMPQLTISANDAFLIDSFNVVYKYDIDLREFYPFTVIAKSVKNPMISVFDYRLMVYDLANEADQTFISAFDATIASAEAQSSEINAYLDEMNSNLSEEEAAYTVLGMASIGAEVQELQSTMISLGYLDIAPTGIYDVNTTVAVQLLQFDLGLEQSGIADAELQAQITDHVITERNGYPTVSRSSNGIIVRDIQARLKTLGYIVNNVTGIMDDATISALEMFSEHNGIEYDGGIITSELLEILFGNEAIAYDGYLLLQVGDCHVYVTQLNQRLKELGYLAGSVNPTFDKKTIDAMKLVGEINDVEVALCDIETQKFIYGSQIKECPEKFRPASLDDAMSSTPGQVISDRQLKIIRKWLTKQFAVNHTDKQAIKRLQMQLVRLGYMQPDSVSMIYDQTTFDAVAAFQIENGMTSDGIASKSVLTDIFSSEINRLAESEEK